MRTYGPINGLLSTRAHYNRLSDMLMRSQLNAKPCDPRAERINALRTSQRELMRAILPSSKAPAIFAYCERRNLLHLRKQPLAYFRKYHPF